METLETEQNRRESVLEFDENDCARQLFGQHNSHLIRIGQALEVRINARGNQAAIQGDPIAVELAENVLRQLYGLIRKGYPIYDTDVDHAVRILSTDHRQKLKDIFLDTVYITSKKRSITPKSRAQKDYIEAIRRSDIVFGVGPAGTGKTYLAMAMAVSALSKGQVNRIVLTRPAVEAGEALGFLPGDLAQKVNPYLRPLYDALHDMIPFEKAGAWMEKGVIEVAPLAFMRGRTLNDSFIVLDEAQNTTSEQMKMFLTRIGYHSKAVITGDITQIDLPNSKGSGLVEVKGLLQGINGIDFVYFGKRDVVRHRLVCDIIQAYEKHEATKAAEKPVRR
ncbi:PhoH family protein [Desulfatibacillum aliphaticivorans]|uniref:PhoH-like protein n=1 Tax=Desulfatibacillum aliphaticivorans TaxID=218208 RepID=B8FJ86_DESAL|nr:PhoH family protein [Desulfatibacillum aliphaticivorans]ACL05013.1 PhoH family protein [Desulfatibacillum aliphaticivorans]